MATSLLCLFIRSFSSNEIDWEGGKAIGESLLTNTSIEKVDLSYNNNPLAPCFLRAVYTFLKKDNAIGSGGAKAIGEALRTNTSLKELYIQMAFRLVSTFSLHHVSSFPNLNGTRLGTTEPKKLENR